MGGGRRGVRTEVCCGLVSQQGVAMQLQQRLHALLTGKAGIQEHMKQQHVANQRGRLLLEDDQLQRPDGGQPRLAADRGQRVPGVIRTYLKALQHACLRPVRAQGLGHGAKVDKGTASPQLVHVVLIHDAPALIHGADG
jgi:hypothetical protein